MAAFRDAPRFCLADADRVHLVSDAYVNVVKESLATHIKATGWSVEWRKPKCAGPPFANWTIKRKSKTAATAVIIKWRPILRHHLHPCFPLLRRVARAMSLLGKYGGSVVRSRMPLHHPPKELHAGTEFLHSLNAISTAMSVLVYDIEDCFLNTPQSTVEDWPASLRATGRRASCFSISKDFRKLDRVGASSSLHF